MARSTLHRLRTSTTKARPWSRFDRALAVTLVAGLALLLILGLVFSIAYGSQQITTNATALHKADESLRAATVARAQLALAVHMATVDRTFGTSSSDAIALSIFEAETALQDLQTGIEELAADQALPDEMIATSAQMFGDTGETIVELLSEGDSPTAQLVSSDTFGPQFTALVDVLVGVRDELAEQVASSDVLLGRIGNIARFLVAFLIPAAVIFIYRELLRRQQRQTDLENRLEAERQLNKAREEFIANASHELRTPLTGITGLAMLLAEDPALGDSESARELLDLIIGESGDLNRMVEDLLTTARLDAGALHYSFEDVEISDEVLEIVGPMVRAGSTISVDCVPGLVRADRLRLRQVVRNLLSNAAKYGGPQVRVSGHTEGRTYVCSVIDDGQGIPEEVVGRLFQRFVHQGHAPAVKESVGLGLSIVHALANGMGGSVIHQRTRGETHFVVRLPLVLERSDQVPTTEVQVTQTRSNVPGP